MCAPNTGQGGFDNFNRYYFAQQDKQGAVIDERYNEGGSAADYHRRAAARPTATSTTLPAIVVRLQSLAGIGDRR